MKSTLMIIVLLSILLLAVGVVHAQEAITLEHVWTTVQGMQSDFLIFARELRSVNNRVDDVEKRLDELAMEPVMIGGEKCLIHIRDELQTQTLNKYVDAFGEEPVMDFLGLRSVYYNAKTDEVEFHFVYSLSIPNRHVYEFWDGCEFVSSSEWRENQ